MRIWVFMLAGLVGCSHSVPRGFDSPEPGARIDAIVETAATSDASRVRDLVRMLESDDALTRMLAIRALEQLTGETYEYDYSAPLWQRRESVRCLKARFE